MTVKEAFCGLHNRGGLLGQCRLDWGVVILPPPIPQPSDGVGNIALLSAFSRPHLPTQTQPTQDAAPQHRIILDFQANPFLQPGLLALLAGVLPPEFMKARIAGSKYCTLYCTLYCTKTKSISLPP